MIFTGEKEDIYTDKETVFCIKGELLTKMTADIFARTGMIALFFGSIIRTMYCGEGIYRVVLVSVMSLSGCAKNCVKVR